jgi:muconolactone delta-isomerase
MRPGSAELGGFAKEYLVTMTTHGPDGTPEQAVDDVRAREAAHWRDLAAEHHLLRLWRPPLQPGEWRTLGLFAAADADQLVIPHPSDPATTTQPPAPEQGKP